MFHSLLLFQKEIIEAYLVVRLWDSHKVHFTAGVVKIHLMWDYDEVATQRGDSHIMISWT